MAITPIKVTSGSAVTSAIAGSSTRSVSNYQISDNALTFIKEQNIGVYATGMRPNTRVYVFFDGYQVSAFATPATLDFTINGPSITDFYSKGSMGTATYTDASGNFAAILRIPSATFLTGERQVIIADVTDLNSISSATTSASYTYQAFSHSATTANNTSAFSSRPTVEYQTPSETLTTNPIAQSIYVGSDELDGADGIFVTSIDLYFQSKDSIQGITIDIRTMQNGVPTQTVLPFSSKYIPASSINISNNSSTVTNIAFPSPVFLTKDTFYAICITANGNNPNYKLYTAVVGQPDLISSNPSYKNWGSGDLFTSTNGFTWLPIPNEYLKFNLNRAYFYSTANSSVSLVNDDYDFLFIKSGLGYFQQGEYAFQLASNVVFTSSNVSGSNTTSNVFINTATKTVSLLGLTGSLTSSLSQFVNTSVVIASNGTINDVLLIDTITSNSTSSSMTVKNTPILSGNVFVQLTPVGRVYNFDVNKLDLSLVGSTASNATFLFSKNSTVVGVQSGATAVIDVVRDRVINRFSPFFNNIEFPTASVKFNMLNTIASTYANTPFSTYSTAQMNYIVDNEVVISSKSSEILNRGSVKSVVANIAMSSNNSYISPAIDLKSSSVLAYRNIIGNLAGSENTKHGQAVNRYISKTVTLSSGLDSEDLVVYIDAYKPANTYINVYGKFLSSSDPDIFDSKDWTQLSQSTLSSLYSDPNNLSDIKEYKFVVPTSPTSTSKVGVITTSTSSNTISGINTTFTKDVAINDLVKIFSDSTKTTFQISKVTAIANNTSLTIDNNSAFTSTSASYERVNYPRTSFLNNQNGNIIRYYSLTGTPYDTFISYAIKIVLLSDVSYLAPRVLNLRSIALT